MNDKEKTQQNESDRNNRLDYILAFSIFIASFVARAIPSKGNPKSDKNQSDDEITKWTRVVGRWTRALVVVGIVTLGVFTLQLLTFIESERATLIAKKFVFVTGEPTSDPEGIATILVLRNVGKHTAAVTKFKATAGIFVVHKELPELPEYKHDVTGLYVIPPLMPDDDRVVFMRQEGGAIHNDTSAALKTRAEVVSGVTDGSIPFRVWGLLEYDDGYFGWRPAQLGFCFEFIPQSKRFGPETFRTCDSPAYTYIR